jgi:hypothetical protein
MNHPCFGSATVPSPCTIRFRGALGLAVPGIEVYLPISKDLILAHMCPSIAVAYSGLKEDARRMGFTHAYAGQGLFDAIDLIVRRNPQHLLHGHEPLTRVFSSPLILSHLKTDLAWLRDQVLTAIRRGDERAAIHESNLIPPDLLAHQPDAHQPYYILREHVIDRIYDQNVGYWEANLQGLAHSGRLDRAELLVDYLGLSDAQIVKAAYRLAADGKYAMAAELIESAEAKFPASDSLKSAKRFVYLKLMEKNQNTDPFKSIIYSGKIGEQTPQINAEHAK